MSHVGGGVSAICRGAAAPAIRRETSARSMLRDVPRQKAVSLPRVCTNCSNFVTDRCLRGRAGCCGERGRGRQRAGPGTRLQSQIPFSNVR